MIVRHAVVIVTLVLGICHSPPVAALAVPASGQKAMVVAGHPLATDVGVAVMKRGGNAVDAAVAAALVVSVTNPFDAGIGGGGFLLFRDGRTGAMKALDFRERAPLSASRTMYQGNGAEDASVDGILSVAVPGTIAGLFEIHRAHGKLPWASLFEGAITAAHAGFVVDRLWVDEFEARKAVLLRHPETKRVFTRGGTPLSAGERLVQRDLAATLARLAQDPRDFYVGETAKKLVNEMERSGGLIVAADLEAYQPVWRSPVCGPYRGHRVCSMPPPSSGGVHLVQMLRMLEVQEVAGAGWHHPDTLFALIEGMRSAYADRAEHLGDPAFTSVPTEALTSAAYAQERRAAFATRKQARRSAEVSATPRARLDAMRKTSKDTSHLSVVDGEGNAVSLTFTVNYTFGSGVVAAGTGILLNDEMDDFASAPGVPNAYGLVGGEANAIAPAKVPLSSMTPTIVDKDGKVRLVVGAPGGSTIITTVLQIIVNVIDYKMNIAQAVAAPRLHHQWLPDVVRLERYGFDAATKAILLRRGFVLEETGPWGNAAAIEVLASGKREGAADPRGIGTAGGF